MKRKMKEKSNRLAAACMIGIMTLALAACSSETDIGENLVSNDARR